jgi:hypothetical protein
VVRVAPVRPDRPFPSRIETVDWERILRQAVSPVLGAYLVFLASFVAYRRAGPARPAIRGWRSLVRHVLTMAAAGYVFFAVVIAVFYFVLGGQSRAFIAEALAEGAVFSFAVVAPALLLLTWAEHRLVRRR